VDIFDEQCKLIGRWQPLRQPKLPSGHFYQATFTKNNSTVEAKLSSDLVKALMPTSGFECLCKNHDLITDFLAHLSGDTDHTNPLTFILQQTVDKTMVENQPDFLGTSTADE
jgi:hypothetical protein